MQKLEIIGNIGADAVVQPYNGQEFVSFRVADTQKVRVNGQETEQTTWIDVTLNGNGGGLFKYLKRGQKVFVSGRPAYRIFDSAKYRCKMVGIQLFANQIELCGASNGDVVPNQLADKDGVAYEVKKCYWAAESGGKELFDGEMKKYVADENGFILPAES